MIQNNGTFIGRLVAEPDYKNQGDYLIVYVRIAVDGGKKNNENISYFFSLTGIGKVAERLQKFTNIKGKRFILEYYQKNNNYQKDGTLLYKNDNMLTNFLIIDSKNENNIQPTNKQQFQNNLDKVQKDTDEQLNWDILDSNDATKSNDDNVDWEI